MAVQSSMISDLPASGDQTGKGTCRTRVRIVPMTVGTTHILGLAHVVPPPHVVWALVVETDVEILRTPGRKRWRPPPFHFDAAMRTYGLVFHHDVLLNLLIPIPGHRHGVGGSVPGGEPTHPATPGLSLWTCPACTAVPRFQIRPRPGTGPSIYVSLPVR